MAETNETQVAVAQPEKKKRKMLNSFTMLFLITAIIAVLTWIIPAGQYQLDDAGNYIAGTYERVAQSPQGIWDLFMAPIRGFLGTETTPGAVEVALFIMVIGGFLGVVTETGAIDAGISAMMKNNKDNMTTLIWGLMFIFVLGGSTYGMNEETMAFYPLLIPLMVAVGMDALVAIAVILLGSGIGCLASTVNPFATVIASDMANISIADGIVIRTIMAVVLWALSAWYVSSYAKKVQEDPKNSLIYDMMPEHKERFKVKEMDTITGKQKGVLWIFGLTFLIMILSLIPWSDLFPGFTLFESIQNTFLDMPFIGNLLGQSQRGLFFGMWYLVEITMLFFMSSVIIGFFYGIDESRFVEVFLDGVKDLLSVAMICAVARGIQVVMNDGQITATVLSWGEAGLKGLNQGLFTILTYLFYIPMSFLIPSTSGLAAATMGIMAPLGDFANVGKDVVVTAYQTACGIVNIITPTSGVVMGALAIAGIELTTWWKFMKKIGIIIVVVSLVLLLASTYLGI